MVKRPQGPKQRTPREDEEAVLLTVVSQRRWSHTPATRSGLLPPVTASPPSRAVPPVPIVVLTVLCRAPPTPVPCPLCPSGSETGENGRASAYAALSTQRPGAGQQSLHLPGQANGQRTRDPDDTVRSGSGGNCKARYPRTDAGGAHRAGPHPEPSPSPGPHRSSRTQVQLLRRLHQQRSPNRGQTRVIITFLEGSGPRTTQERSF